MEKIVGITKYNNEWTKIVQVFCPTCKVETPLDLDEKENTYTCLKCDTKFKSELGV